MTRPLSLRFDVDDANRAGDIWSFNCGPAAICAVLSLTPDELRPHLGDFERKGYTNPTLMYETLARLGATWRSIRGARRANAPASEWPRWGLARIQWDGPWTAEGVPIRARYHKTHWVGSFVPEGDAPCGESHRVFDVNAICVGGWLGFYEWATQLVPWLLRECEPKASGKWWVTHGLEIES